MYSQLLSVSPITVGHSLQPITMYVSSVDQSIYAEQSRIIKEMTKNSSCVIVGRCADEILKEYQPIRIFVYADMESRMKRCQFRRSQEETYSEKELRQRILEIDKKRSKYYEFYTGKKWGDKRNYDYCINTGHLDIKELAEKFAKLIEVK